MFNDPYDYHQMFQETEVALKLALPEAPDPTIRIYILNRLNSSQWCAGHVFSVIQAQAKLGVFIYADGLIKFPPEFPEDWRDAPIVAFIELGDKLRVTPKEAALLAQELYAENYAPWFVKYPARVKRWVKEKLKTIARFFDVESP